MKKVILMIALLATGSFAAEAAKPKIGLKKATRIASAKVPGKIKSHELEKENGKWIYSFDIKTDKKGVITEVNIDAYTGEVLDVHEENAADEAKEKREEKKEKN